MRMNKSIDRMKWNAFHQHLVKLKIVIDTLKYYKKYKRVRLILKLVFISKNLIKIHQIYIPSSNLKIIPQMLNIINIKHSNYSTLVPSSNKIFKPSKLLILNNNYQIVKFKLNKIS